jgi:hypothetical protein
MSGYTGQWKQQAYHNPPRWAFALDPSHGEIDTPDPQSAVYAAPPMPEVSDIGEFPGLEYFSPRPGIVLDTTPVTHDGPGHPLTDDDRAMQAHSLAAHGLDFGASREENSAPPFMDFYDEKQIHTVVEGLAIGSTEISPVAQARGLNGLAENNDISVTRAGQTHLWRYQRKFQVGERRHDERPTTLNLPYMPQNAPPPANFTVYNSPFGSMARPITRFFNRPAVRRDPRGLSQDIVTDNAGDYSQPLGSEWVM